MLKTKRNRELTEELIISTVADYYNMTESQITSKVRTSQIALARRIAISMEEEIKNANLDGEDDKFESEDLNTVNSKALYIIRKLRDFGWINIDFNAKNSFEEYIAVPVSEMIDLIADQMKLMALEGGGVDNWSAYGWAIGDYLEECKHSHCYDMNKLREYAFMNKASDETVEEYIEEMGFEEFASFEVWSM